MKMLIQTSIHVVLSSLVLAGLIKLDVSLALKVLLLGLFGYFYLFVFSIETLVRDTLEQVNRLLHFQRATFIAIEMQRLDPEDKQPALDRLTEDMATDTRRLEFESSPAGVKMALYVIMFALYAALVAVAVVNLLHYL